jgi:hypothetical protein
VIGVAVANRPEIHEGYAKVQKARAALAAGKLDFVPSVPCCAS